jgi:hypothetical protein
MFLAHFTGTPLGVLLEWDLDDLYYWHVEAVKLHNKLNPKPEK